MTKAEFLNLIDEMIEAEPGTVREDHPLDGLEGWDSLAMVGLLAAVHERLGIALPAERISTAGNVKDLEAMVAERLEG